MTRFYDCLHLYMKSNSSSPVVFDENKFLYHCDLIFFLRSLVSFYKFILLVDEN